MALYDRILAKLQNSVTRFGWRGAIRRWSLQMLYSVLGIKIWVCLKLEKANPDLAKLPQNFRAGFIDPLLLASYVGAGSEFNHEFLETASTHNLEAWVIIDHDRGFAACIDWIAPLPSDFGEHLTLFPRNTVYGQRIETHPDYRGRGLFAAAVHGALIEYQKRGYRAMVAHVEAHNLASLRGAYRGQHERVGFAVVGKWFGKHYVVHSAGCKRNGIHYEPLKIVTGFPVQTSKLPAGS
jgi:GNAT superfamily N-acetyltransferase